MNYDDEPDVRDTVHNTTLGNINSLDTFATQINDTTVKLPSHKLKHGVFVCRLDRPWVGTPFLLQGFLVQTDSELHYIKEHCRYIYVDPSRSVISLDLPVQKPLKRTKQNDGVSLPPSVDLKIAKASLKNILPAYRETITTLRQCHESFQNSTLLTPDPIYRNIEQSLESVIKNTAAVSWLSRVKSHHQYLYEHAMHVSLLAMVFAVHCGWTKDEAKKVGVAGLLCDIGHLKTPRHLLAKNEPFFESEWQIIKQHPKSSRHYLERSGFDTEVIESAYFHHERPDGNGYPSNKLGIQIPRTAKLLHIIDAFDAMISHRPYATQKTVFEATRILYRGRGTEFDSDLVDQFIEMIGVYPTGTIIELSTGEVGVVIGQNHSARLLPKVSILRDKNKHPVKETLANLKSYVDADGKPTVTIKAMLSDGSHGIYMEDYTRTLLMK